MRLDTPDDSHEGDDGGPTDAPYPSGSRPAGPGAEWMSPDNFTSSVEAWNLGEIEPALARVTEIRARLRSHPAVILNFEGLADSLGADRKAVLGDLSRHVPVAVVGDRLAATLRTRVAVDDITYVGTDTFPSAQSSIADLDSVEQRLLREVAEVEGIGVERTPASLAVRVPRSAPDSAHSRAHDLVAGILRDFPGLVVHGTDEIHELRPASDRRTVITQLLAHLNDPTPLYLGGGLAPEPAFRAVGEAGGIGIVLSPETDDDRATWAEYRLSDIGETIEFLRRLARSLAGDPNP